MWKDLPGDVLAHIFSFLPPDSFACAKSTCRNWHECPCYFHLPELSRRRGEPAWFIAMPNRTRGLVCYAQNPVDNRRYMLPLDFIPTHIRPVSPVGGLILFRPISTAALQLAVCNPFTRQFRHLPMLNVARTNPAVGTIDELSISTTSIPGNKFNFRVYVVGGMSDAPSGGASYEPTMEMYDLATDRWVIIGPVPMEYAVRLTVWTPNESVFCNGVLYWMTSARAYTVMGFEIATGKWKELSVPLADRLEFAALVRRNGKLTLLGGKCGGDAYAWELLQEGEGGEEAWRVVEKVPCELGMKFLGGKGCWDNTKCVGNDGMVCLYKDLRSGMLAWREVDDNGGSSWEWFWIDGCCSIRGHQLQNLQIKGLLLYPNMVHSTLFNS